MTCQNVQQSQNTQSSQNAQNSVYLSGVLAGTLATSAVVVGALAINSLLFSGSSCIPCNPPVTPSILGDIDTSLILDKVMSSSPVAGGCVGAFGGFLVGLYRVGNNKDYELNIAKIQDAFKTMTSSTIYGTAAGAFLLTAVRNVWIS